MAPGPVDRSKLSRLGQWPEVVAWIDKDKLMMLTTPAERELGACPKWGLEQDGVLRNRCSMTPSSPLTFLGLPLLWEILKCLLGVSSHLRTREILEMVAMETKASSWSLRYSHQNLLAQAGWSSLEFWQRREPSWGSLRIKHTVGGRGS